MVMILDKAILYGKIVVLKKGLRLYFSLATESLHSQIFFLFFLFFYLFFFNDTRGMENGRGLARSVSIGSVWVCVCVYEFYYFSRYACLVIVGKIHDKFLVLLVMALKQTIESVSSWWTKDNISALCHFMTIASQQQYTRNDVPKSLASQN